MSSGMEADLPFCGDWLTYGKCAASPPRSSMIRRVNYYPGLILGCLACLVFVYAGPQIVDFSQGTLVSVKHVEAVSISTYGRFHGQAFVTDPYSGEFPTFYNFLSDWSINFLAEITDLPPFLTQAVIFVPLLITVLFLGTYWSVRSVGAEPKTALLASVLVISSSETPFVHYLYPLLKRWSGLEQLPLGNLISPAAGMGAATSQITGWVIFLPVLASLYIAKNADIDAGVGRVKAAFAGGMLGLACLVHTLTFLHLGTICCLYLAVETIVCRTREGRLGEAVLRSIAIIGLTLCIVRLSQRNGLSMANFVVFWAGCLVISVRNRQSIYFSIFYGLGALIVASPFLYQIWELSLNPNRFDSYDSPVNKYAFAVYYAAHIGCCLIVILNVRRQVRPDILIWLLVMLLASWMLGYGKIFGFQNHEYRFLSNMIIPLSVLAAFLLSLPPSHSQKLGLYLFLPLLLVGVVRNVWTISGSLPEPLARYIGPFTSYNGVVPLPRGAAGLLERVRSETKALVGDRILTPPEYSYPQQAYRNGLILGVSQIPDFIPDPRFIVWGDLYADRVAVFCSLFPDYPQYDAPHTQLHLCEQTPKEIAPGMLSLRALGASTDVLSLYRVQLLALLDGDYDRLVADRAALLGMTQIYDDNGGMLWKTATEQDPNRLSFGAATYTAPNLSIPVVAPQPGKYLIVLAGNSISTRVQQVQLGPKTTQPHSLGDGALAISTDLPAGSSQLILVLAPEPRFRFVFPTPIRQIIGVRREAAEQFLAGPSLQQLLR
jgi:hypothetical protein